MPSRIPHDLAISHAIFRDDPCRKYSFSTVASTSDTPRRIERASITYSCGLWGTDEVWLLVETFPCPIHRQLPADSWGCAFCLSSIETGRKDRRHTQTNKSLTTARVTAHRGIRCEIQFSRLKSTSSASATAPPTTTQNSESLLRKS